MKKLLIPLLIVISVVSCKNETKTQNFFNEGEVTITGKIQNYSPDKDSINEVSFIYSNLLDFDIQNKAVAKINDNGSFSTKFTISNPQVIFFYFDNSGEVYVEPNTTLNLDFNSRTASNLEFEKSFVFNGDLKKENEDLRHYKTTVTFDRTSFYKKFNALKTPKEAFKLIDSTYSIETKKSENFLTENNLSDNISNWIELESKLNPISDLLSYAIFSFRPNDKNKNFNDHFPKEYLEEINNIPLINEESFVNTEIYSFLPNYYNAYLRTSIHSQTKDWKKVDSVLYTDKKYAFKNNPEFFKILLFDKLSNQLKNNDTLFYHKNEKLITTTFKDTKYENAIKDKLVLVRELIKNPNLPENSQLLSLNTNNADDIFSEIVKNANGKVIYIDNWATWCGPCKAEFKESTPKLKNKFKDDIEFVYLCHQSDKNQYKPTIAQYQIEGKHYFMNEEQTKNLTKLLNIRGFPNYTIVDKNGKIVKSGFEYRPSREETHKILTSLIQ